VFGFSIVPNKGKVCAQDGGYWGCYLLAPLTCGMTATSYCLKAYAVNCSLVWHRTASARRQSWGFDVATHRFSCVGFYFYGGSWVLHEILLYRIMLKMLRNVKKYDMTVSKIGKCVYIK